MDEFKCFSRADIAPVGPLVTSKCTGEKLKMGQRQDHVVLRYIMVVSVYHNQPHMCGDMSPNALVEIN